MVYGKPPIEIYVYLPSRHLRDSESPIHVHGLVINLPSFSHVIGDLQSSYEFDHFVINSYDGPANAQVRFDQTN